MQKLDKKQVPQFAALCVLSAGVFGYFVVKVVAPSPAAAGTRPRPVPVVALVAPVTASPATAATGATGAAAATPATPPDADVPAPTPGMRDPFVVGYVDPSVAVPAAAAPPVPAAAPKPAKAPAPQVATIREVTPAPVGAPALPFGLKSFPPMGAAPERTSATALRPLPAPTPAPLWAVTGVLQSPGGSVAILRNGEARRIVRNGDSVDSLYRVVAVTRAAVVLRHGKTFYRLALGADKAGPGKPAAPTHPQSSPAPAFMPMPQASAQAPTAPLTGTAQVIEAALMMAHSYMTPAQARVDACLASLRAPGAQTAQDAFDLDRDLYAAGPAAEGGARWVCALATTDYDTMLPAVKPAELAL